MHLFERQPQLERLKQCLQGARAGSGKVVLLVGEAGVGKSSLVERSFRSTGATCARCGAPAMH